MNRSNGHPATTIHWWSKVSGLAHAAMQHDHRPHQDHPTFHVFLEQSALAREMRHL